MAEEGEVSLANEKIEEDVTRAVQGMKLEVEAAAKRRQPHSNYEDMASKEQRVLHEIDVASRYGSDVMDKLITKKINVARLNLIREAI
jgi:hypothetical protein